MMLRVHSYSAFCNGHDLSGNMAGVCLVNAFPTDAQMQEVATRTGHSETAFLVESRTENGHFLLRWFTPTVEVPLCGHATLAASAHLAQHYPACKEFSFQTQAGKLTSRAITQADSSLLAAQIFLPVASISSLEASTVSPLVSTRIIEAFRSQQSVVGVLASAQEVRDAAPNLDAIKMLDAEDLILTAMGEQENQIVCRVFSPQLGLDEDPVTGSAQSSLAPYWTKRLQTSSYHAIQLSPQGGEMQVRWNPEDTHIELKGLVAPVAIANIDIHPEIYEKSA
jgi:PhzF family phenazine biosynthesis protein